MSLSVTLTPFQHSYQLACEVQESVAAGSLVNARQKARELYKKSEELIVAELEGKPLISELETYLPIVYKIQDALLTQGFYDSVPLMRTLSKVFRAFLELRWYHPYRLGVYTPVPLQEKDKFVATAKDLSQLLATRQDATEAIFELKCAEEAAKRLSTPENLWLKYADHILTTTAAGVDRSASGIWTAVKNFATDIKKDCPRDWYLWYQSVHILRWESSRAYTIDKFDNKISANIEMCKKQGGVYSTCLAVILMRVIKSSNEDDVRLRAFRGFGGNLGLVQLIQLKGPIDKKEALLHPFEKIGAAFGGPDRFWGARQLAVRYLMKLATKDKYSAYHEESKQALLNRRFELNKHKKNESEKAVIQRTIEECAKRRNETHAKFTNAKATSKQLEEGRAGEDRKDESKKLVLHFQAEGKSIEDEIKMHQFDVKEIEMLEEELKTIDLFLSKNNITIE